MPNVAEPGLRERKKQRTRQLIAETARALFAERGFAGVTVAEIAEAADVSQKTVFNYFPTKEDLVYWQLEAFEQELLAAIRERDPGESALSAFARFITRQRGLLGRADEGSRERLAALTRTIVESPSLLAREQQIFAGYTRSLATLLAEETGGQPGDLRPWVAANAMMGVHRALVDDARARIVAGERGDALAAGVRKRADAALGLLGGGRAGYALKAAP
jgi:AcrR family transcriptional regulator